MADAPAIGETRAAAWARRIGDGGRVLVVEDDGRVTLEEMRFRRSLP
ncbi:hypothetical protein [Amycolatopsis sp. NPDC051102]